jgi:hypothetical protein
MPIERRMLSPLMRAIPVISGIQTGVEIADMSGNITRTPVLRPFCQKLGFRRACLAFVHADISSPKRTSPR